MSTRELSILIWGSVVLVLSLGHRTLRASFLNVVKAFFAWKLSLIWITLALYVIATLWSLYNVGYWNYDLLKETAVWFCFTALAYTFQFQEPSDKRTIAGTILRDAISALIVIELLVDTYTFHLAIELVLVPLMVLITMMAVVAESRPEHRQVASLMKWLQITVGLLLVVTAIRSAVNDPLLDPSAMARELLLPVILSAATIPYVYWLTLWVAYDELPWRFGRTSQTSWWFRQRAALSVLVHVRFHPAGVRLFLRRQGL